MGSKICFGYWAECPEGCTRKERLKSCNDAENCFDDWYKSGGRLGLEGLMASGKLQ